MDGPDQSSPQPLPYLQETSASAYDIELKVDIKRKLLIYMMLATLTLISDFFYTASESSKFETVTVSNLKHMYWSITQQLAHHTVNGCNLRPGDMGATGTISGPVS